MQIGRRSAWVRLCAVLAVVCAAMSELSLARGWDLDCEQVVTAEVDRHDLGDAPIAACRDLPPIRTQIDASRPAAQAALRDTWAGRLTPAGAGASRLQSAPLVESGAASPAGVDPLLDPAIAALQALELPAGDGSLARGLLDLIDRVGVQIQVRPLPRGVHAEYAVRANTIAIGEYLLDEHPRVTAALIAHELTHARQVQIGRQDVGQACIQMEVEAFMLQGLVWDALWSGQPPRVTPIERELTAISTIVLSQGEPGMHRLVANSPSYQSQCSLADEATSPGQGGPAAATPAPAPASRVPVSATPIPTRTLLSTPTPRVTPQPTQTPTPTFPADRKRAFEGTSDARTGPFALRGGDYVITWKVDVGRPTYQASCSVLGYLRQRDGWGAWPFETGWALERKSVEDQIRARNAPPGYYYLDLTAHGNSCAWSVSVEPAP